MLADGVSTRQQRLLAEDMMSMREAAELLGKSRATINVWIAKGRAIGLTGRGGAFRLPRWQFEPLVWDALSRLATALGMNEGWALLAFIETPHGGLEGLTPRAAIEQGQEKREIELAQSEGN